MAEERGQKPVGRIKRQRTGVLQRSQSGEARVESPSARRWPEEEIFLRQNVRDEEETYFGKDSK